MAVYLKNKCLSFTKNELLNKPVVQVATLKRLTDSDHLYYLTTREGIREAGLYYLYNNTWIPIGKSVGGGGTTDYNDMLNKPRINNVELIGDIDLIDIDAALVTDTYSQNDINSKLAATQKAYVTDVMPTSSNAIGLYYYKAAGDTNYRVFLVDTDKNVVEVTEETVDLSVFQMELDSSLNTNVQIVSLAINELKTSLDAITLDAETPNITTGDISISTFSSSDKLTWVISHYYNLPEIDVPDQDISLQLGDSIKIGHYKIDTKGHFKEYKEKPYVLPSVTINTETNPTNPTIYAPTTAGTKGEVLYSQGASAKPV